MKQTDLMTALMLDPNTGAMQTVVITEAGDKVIDSKTGQRLKIKWDGDASRARGGCGHSTRRPSSSWTNPGGKVVIHEGPQVPALPEALRKLMEPASLPRWLAPR